MLTDLFKIGANFGLFVPYSHGFLFGKLFAVEKKFVVAEKMKQLSAS